MTNPVPILVPQEVVNDTSVRVVKIAVVSGQEVSLGQPLVELETSKSNIQVESPAAGWLLVLCKVGDDVPVGGLIGHVFGSQSALDAASQPSLPPSQPAPAEAPAVTIFSKDARALLQASGMDEAAFKGRAFVRAADVQALLGKEGLTAPDESAMPEHAGASGVLENKAFEQTFAHDWPLWMLVRSDLHRIDGRHDNVHLLHHWRRNPGFRYVLWFRIAQWARQRAWRKLLVYPLAIWRLERCHLQSGIRIPLAVKAGPGLLVGHWGGIWISPSCTLGANCSLGNDINIGSAGGAGQVGVPKIGDNVFIGPGSRIAGPVKVGQCSAIMPNSLVTADVPPGSIVIGVPHRISGHRDSNTFVSNTNYPRP